MTTDDEEINRLRLPWESSDQWQLREAFLRKHWDSEIKNRLVCLSQIFINIEFMGCQYKPELMQKVQLMSEGLADERRTERRQIIEKTFVKASDGKSATLKQKRAHERAQEPKNPFAPPTKKPRDDIVEASTAAKSSSVVGKEKTLTLVKAQLSVAPNHLDPLALVNFACGRAKISWQLEMAESNREFRLFVHDVLVVRQTCKDAASARQAGCAAAAERLRSVNLEVRQEMVKDAQRFVLYTAVDRRSGWIGPDKHFFAGVEQRLAIVRELLIKKNHGDNAEQTLQEVCQNERIDLEIVESQLGGWKQELTVQVAGARVYAHVFQGKECAKTADNRRLVCAKAIELLRKPIHQVVEADDGTFTLVAGDEASDDHLRAALTGGSPPTPEHCAAVSEQQCKQFVLLLNAGVDVDALVGGQAKAILHQSAGFSKMLLSFDSRLVGQSHECSVIIEGLVVSKVAAESERTAMHEASMIALQRLRRVCYALTAKGTNAQMVGEAEAVCLPTDNQDDAASTSECSQPTMDKCGIGAQLLKKMGWKEGGGVGRQEQGIRTPVLLAEQQLIGRSRLGLGAHADDAKFRATVRRVLEQQLIEAYDRDELVFSEELSKTERMVVHKEATRLNLHTKSFDVTGGRRLRVYRRRSAAAVLAAAICGQDGRYEVMAPTTAATRVDQPT